MADDRRLSADEVASRAFSTGFRGLDANEVRAYLQRVADDLRAGAERESALATRLAEAEERAAHPEIDEDTLLRLLGEETARVMRSAREAAADLKAHAEESVQQILKDAHDEAKRVRSAAESVLAEQTELAEAEAQALREQARRDAAAMIESATAEAEAALDQVRERAKAMVVEAQSARERILSDLARRRRVAHVQVEQLRAGRDRLLDAYRMVRSTLEDVTDELQRAEAEARQAAEATARRLAAEGDDALAEQADDEAGEDGGADEAGQAGGEIEDAEVGPDVEVAVEEEADQPVAVESAAIGSAAIGSAAGGSAAVEQVAPRLVTTTVEAASPAPVTAAPSRPASVPVEERRLSSLRIIRREREREREREAGSDPPQPEPVAAVSELDVVEPAAPDEAVRILAPVAAEVEAAPAPDVEAAKPAVEDVFARLRASREESVAKAREVLAEPEPEAKSEPDPEPESKSEPDPEPEHREAVEGEPAVSNEDERALQERDEAVADIEARLARKLKRSLQDEQNDVLDRLRSRRSRSTEGVLPALDEHLARHVAVALPFLEQAGPGVDVAAVAHELADAIVGPLRRQLEPALRGGSNEGDDGEGDDAEESDPADRIGAAYREWKGDRIERLASHAVVSAWSRAAYRSVAEGTVLRWVVDDQGAPCPDCDDNALAGPTAKGDEYPTGQQHPPAHAGCRCLLVRAST
ncbi:MAG: hypothetical protein QOK43_2784 [Acidimicrobiaceae bacterium]|nr:hypothetical protein [Acidimicrobiaceae bacterium]